MSGPDFRRNRPDAPLTLEVGGPNDVNLSAILQQAARHEPFRQYAVGVVVPAVREQLVHGANVMAVRNGRLEAYAGWLRVPREAARAWEAGGELPSADWAAGDAAIITIFLADHSGDLPALVRGVSDVCRGLPVYRMRVFNDARLDKRRTPILGRGQGLGLKA